MLILLLVLFAAATSDDFEQNCQLGNSKYSKENNRWQEYLDKIEEARQTYKPCDNKRSNCLDCYGGVLERDLQPWENGISRDSVLQAAKMGKATRYQVVNHRLYRTRDCMFPFRCTGLEHFLLQIIDDLDDTEFVVNVRDWPQIMTHVGLKLPIFSFSKVPNEHMDILYPAWAFWAGGPAISLYPQGLGRWDQLKESIMLTAATTPWQNKSNLAFFRGSRTNSERDPLIKLSRQCPKIVDAQYTKNQAWKSNADTLGMEPAEEVSLEHHCMYKYLFNFRGVAASFRFKHLFLCKSLVLHVGNQWEEFFYSALRPWIHYVPVPSKANEKELFGLLHFLEEYPDVARNIADAGADFITNNLTMEDVSCYWKIVLAKYTALLAYTVTKDDGLVEITR